jgi:hypothetical protein
MDKDDATFIVEPDQVFVIFDTSSIHPGSEMDKLLSSHLADYAKLRPTVRYKLRICIPEIALRERRYQIKQKAISAWQKAEASLRFLCQTPPLTREEAVQAIFANLEGEIRSTEADILPLEFSSVDIEAIANASIERQPPFSPSGEKGFRDALIAESIVHFVRTLSTDPQKCLVMVVIRDKLLLKALEERGLPSNLEYVDSHDDALNRLVARGQGVTYSAVQNILDQACDVFISRDWKSGLFCDEKLETKILEQFEKEILDSISFVPAYFEKEDFFISTPSLVRVDGNVWHFVTLVEFQGGLWVAGYCDDIDHLEQNILKQPVRRKVLDPDDGFLSALLNKLCITFRIDWRAERIADDRLYNPSLSAMVPYMKKSLGREHVFTRKPELLGLRSPEDRGSELMVLREIDKKRHGYVGIPDWHEAHREHDSQAMSPEDTPPDKR